MKSTTMPKTLNQLEARMTEARDIIDNAIAAAQQLGLAHLKDWTGEATIMEHLAESKSALLWARTVVSAKAAEQSRAQTRRHNGNRKPVDLRS